jgi:hypothetical protein
MAEIQQLQQLQQLQLFLRLINTPAVIIGNQPDILTQSFNEQEEVTIHPTEKKFIENLKEIKCGEGPLNISCGICLEKCSENDNIIVLPCGNTQHYFHLGDNNDDCPGILPWLKENNTCPICRYVFPEEKENDVNESCEDNTNELQGDIYEGLEDINEIQDTITDNPIINLTNILFMPITSVNNDEDNIDDPELQEAIRRSISDR